MESLQKTFSQIENSNHFLAASFSQCYSPCRLAITLDIHSFCSPAKFTISTQLHRHRSKLIRMENRRDNSLRIFCLSISLGPDAHETSFLYIVLKNMQIHCNLRVNLRIFYDFFSNFFLIIFFVFFLSCKIFFLLFFTLLSVKRYVYHHA
jgi:hypothetical protein